MKMVYFMLILLAIAYLGRKSALVGRTKLSDESLMKLFNCGKQGLEAIRILERCYSIKGGYLRPTDRFDFKKDSILVQYDACMANAGYNEFEDYLFDNGVSPVPANWTVGDFVNWYVEKNGKKNAKD